MKCFAFTSPQGFTAPQAVADLNTVVINRRDQHLFAQFPVFFDRAALAAGCAPIGEIKLQLNGPEASAVGAAQPALWQAIERAAFALARDLFPPGATDVV